MTDEPDASDIPETIEFWFARAKVRMPVIRCDGCKYWDSDAMHTVDNLDINLDGDVFVVGQCLRAMPFWDATTWTDEGGRAIKPEFADRKMFAQDGFDYRATVYTTPDFFCPQFKVDDRPAKNQLYPKYKEWLLKGQPDDK